MKEHKIKNFVELHEVLSLYRKNNSWIFRGQSNIAWELKPKVGRDEYKDINDEQIFRAWKRRAFEFVSLPFEDDWNWLATAQHHGLATRLLDWTFNPLAATYFAVSGNDKSDAVIYAYQEPWHVRTEVVAPFASKGVKKFKPTGVASRIIRQSGIFTIHENSNENMEAILNPSKTFEKIVTEESYREELVFELSHYGVNKATLFPDLDGLSSHLNWIATNFNYWEKTPIELAT